MKTIKISNRDQFKIIQKFINVNVSYIEASGELKIKGTLEEQENNSKIILNILKYYKRKKDGEEYAFYMNARVIAIEVDGLTELENDNIREQIDIGFSETETVLRQGKWKSALRLVNLVVPTAYISQDLIDEIKNYIQAYVNEDY